MNRSGALLLCVVTVVALATSGCGANPPAPVTTTAAAQPPIATCVSQAEQRTNGVSLPLPGNNTLDALHYGSGSAAVVFAEQSGDDVCEWQFNAKDLAGKGYQTVVFNYTFPADKDVLAAIDFVRSRGVKRVFLVGASKGGTAVLTAAGEVNPPVSGVVSLSGPTGFEGMDALTPMSTFTTPVIFIVGDNDEPFTSMTQQLYQRCTSKDKQLILRHTGDHVVALMDAATTTLIENFFASH
jgi:hypothetical protein